MEERLFEVLVRDFVSPQKKVGYTRLEVPSDVERWGVSSIG